WVAGISIGAVNAALIAGNPIESRIDKLRAFWDLVTSDPLSGWAAERQEQSRSLVDAATDSVAAAITAPLALTLPFQKSGDAASVKAARQQWKETLANAASAFSSFKAYAEPHGDVARSLANRWHATVAALSGASGFFSPRPVNPALQPAGTVEATSYYDTSP